MARESQYKTGRTYNIEVVIDGDDYSDDVQSFRMVTSLAAVYQTFEISLLLDPLDTLLEGGILGQDDVSVYCTMLKENSEEQSQIGFELLIIGGCETKLMNRPQLTTDNSSPTGQQNEKVNYTLKLVEKDAFKKMTSFVNKIYEGKTIQEIIQDLCDEVDCKLEIDTDGIMSEPISQVIIPPGTLYNSIHFLNDNFGIYDGVLGTFCFSDTAGETEDEVGTQESTLWVMNLTKRIGNTEVFTVYHQATDSDKTKDMEEKTSDGSKLVSWAPITTDYVGNARFATLAKNINYVVKPKDDLFYTINKDLQDICLNNGLTDNATEIQFNSVLNDRTAYITEFNGNERNETFVISAIAQDIYDLVYAEVIIERNLTIEHFLEVGSPILLETMTAEYQEVAGKYIVTATDLGFTRDGREWKSLGTLMMNRTNKLSS